MTMPLLLWVSFLPAAIVLGESSRFAVAAEAPTSRSDETIRENWNEWNTPFEPFRIIGNVYYVGAAGISSFLIRTPQGHILIDTGFEMTVPRITNSVAELGFRLRDIRILLSSHAHLDHTGGHALMKSLTGARICISEQTARSWRAAARLISRLTLPT